MTAISYATAVDPRKLPFKDRRTSLKVVGVLLIIFGALSGCFGLLAPVGMYLTVMFGGTAPGAATQPMQPALPTRPDYHTMVLAGITYVLLSAAMIWLGVGSLRIRRWVRPVILVIGWTWLLTGVVSFAHWALFGASMREMMTATWQPGMPQPPRALVYTVTALMGTLTFLLLVALPALLTWLYQRDGVLETVEYFDPRFAWTDRCPTPVLAVCLWLALGGVGAAVYSVYGVLPLFGRYVTGAPAVAALLAVAAVYLWLAWGAYRLRPWAWWGAALAWTLWAGSMIWTFTRLGYHEFYRQAGYSPQEIDLMMRYGGQYEDAMVWMIALWSAALVGYLLYVRKFFAAGPPPGPADPLPDPAAE
jgi:hypothetical protein